MEENTIGINIKKIRQEKGLTQKKLAQACNMYESQIRKYESGKVKPKINTLGKISKALEVPITKLDANIIDLSELSMNITIDDEKKSNPFWCHELEDTLNKIGYSIGFDGELPAFWINYPDGSLEVTEDELKELQRTTVSYIKFQLEELKQRHIKDLKPYKDLPY